MTVRLHAGAWAIGGALACTHASEAEEGADVWEHEEHIIPWPTGMNPLPAHVQAAAVCMHFDGGCCMEDRQCTGGFIAWNINGQCMGGRGLWYSADVHTNNIAEA